MIVIAAKISQGIDVAQGELKRLQRLIEAHQPDGAPNLPRGAQHGQRIGCRAQPDIPNDKFATMLAQPPRQIELPHIERLCLRRRPDDWVKGFAMRFGVDAVSAVDQLDEAIGHQE